MSDEAVDSVLTLATPRTFASGAWLLKAGERAQWCFFIAQGLVRELYLDDSGQEHNRRFLTEGQVTGSLLDLISGEPAITWIQALEDTRTLAWRYADFEALCAKHRELETAARHLVEALYVFKTRREYELLVLPATERHARWLHNHEDLDARISRRHLASYLGVTPEHLSRLRRPG